MRNVLFAVSATIVFGFTGTWCLLYREKKGQASGGIDETLSGFQFTINIQLIPLEVEARQTVEKKSTVSFNKKQDTTAENIAVAF